MNRTAKPIWLPTGRATTAKGADVVAAAARRPAAAAPTAAAPPRGRLPVRSRRSSEIDETLFGNSCHVLGRDGQPRKLCQDVIVVGRDQVVVPLEGRGRQAKAAAQRMHSLRRQPPPPAGKTTARRATSAAPPPSAPVRLPDGRPVCTLARPQEPSPPKVPAYRPQRRRVLGASDAFASSWFDEMVKRMSTAV